MADRPKNKPKGDYEVGYAKTPEHSRFKKGAPNPSRGRQKGSKNKSGARRVLEDIKIRMTVDGKKRSLPLGEAVTLKAGQAALQGDPVAQRIIVNAQLACDKMAEPGPEPPSFEEQLKKQKAARAVNQAMVGMLDLHSSLLFYGILHKDEQGRLTIPASVAREAEKHRPGGSVKRPGGGDADQADEPDVVLDPNQDISPEERRHLLDEVTPGPIKEMMARAVAQQPKRRKRKATQAPQGEAGEEASHQAPSDGAEGSEPSEAEDQSGGAQPDVEAVESGPEVEPTPDEPAPRPTAHDRLWEYWAPKKKD